MSTCSTPAASALRGHEIWRRRRRAAPPSCDAGGVVVEAVHGRLERRLVEDLERDCDAYKMGRPGAPRHRRSRSATGGTPSSAAVTTVVAPDANGLLLPLHRCSSPRRLVSALQRTSSADSDRAAKRTISDAGGGDYSPTGPSSVCSVEGGYPVAASSSSCSLCPCRCRCRCRCAVCWHSYSTSSSCTGAVAPLFSPAEGSTAGEHARKRKSDGGRWWAAGRAAWISAIALVVVVVFGAMVILELSGDDGCAAYLVPT